ncbi:small integral membrane protein 26-like [Brachyistius frenatus]|uniref:small integral membrane protein 26-like n=1 Tax=Brachyistius frenatus TaxID=100188 RepID=UPI0037E88429
MHFKDLLRWNTRVSAVYAVGMWTMIGSYAYFRYTGRYEDRPVEPVEMPVNPNEVVFETAYTKTTIVYKEDFVPYSTRVYNFISSFSGGPETGDK